MAKQTVDAGKLLQLERAEMQIKRFNASAGESIWLAGRVVKELKANGLWKLAGYKQFKDYSAARLSVSHTTANRWVKAHEWFTLEEARDLGAEQLRKLVLAADRNQARALIGSGVSKRQIVMSKRNHYRPADGQTVKLTKEEFGMLCGAVDQRGLGAVAREIAMSVAELGMLVRCTSASVPEHVADRIRRRDAARDHDNENKCSLSLGAELIAELNAMAEQDRISRTEFVRRLLLAEQERRAAKDRASLAAKRARRVGGARAAQLS